MNLCKKEGSRMKQNSKDTIYMALDLLESMNKTSNVNPNFIHINESELKTVKKELFDLIGRLDDKHESIQEKKIKLIGTLPYVLMDKSKFPTNESIVKFAKESLGMNISTWQKRGREEMIGLVISKIAYDQENKFEQFMDIWKEFIVFDDIDLYGLNQYVLSNSNKKNLESKLKNEDFVQIWLNFFNKYRGKK